MSSDDSVQHRARQAVRQARRTGQIAAGLEEQADRAVESGGDVASLFAGVRHAVSNALTSRSALLTKMLDPRRDLNTECGYITDPQASDFNDMYKQEGVARRVVHVLPEESWQVQPTVYETEDPEETEFERAWRDLAEAHDLFTVLARADIISGIGRFGVIVLGIDDGRRLAEEAVFGASGRQLLYARPFDESVVKIQAMEKNTASPRYGHPIRYAIQFETSVGGTTSSVTEEVHWTRVIHLADNRRMSDVLGVPRLRPVFNRLQDLRKLLGGSAEMFWQGAFPGFSVEVDPKLLEAGMSVNINVDDVKEQILNYVNGLQRWLQFIGLTVKTLAPQVSDPAAHIEAQLKAIAISLGIPYRVFIGTEEGRLAGGQDARAWAQRVRHRQINYLTPFVVRPLIRRLIDLGVLPEPQSLTIEWPEMLSPSEQERAEIAKVRTEAIKTFVQGDGEQVVPLAFWLTEILGLETEQADAIIHELEQGEAV